MVTSVTHEVNGGELVGELFPCFLDGFSFEEGHPEEELERE